MERTTWQVPCLLLIRNLPSTTSLLQRLTKQESPACTQAELSGVIHLRPGGRDLLYFQLLLSIDTGNDHLGRQGLPDSLLAIDKVGLRVIVQLDLGIRQDCRDLIVHLLEMEA